MKAIVGEKELGYCLFAGQSYAVSPPSVMMLGLNPGMSESDKPNSALQSINWLLNGVVTRRLPYWRNAQRLFKQRGLEGIIEKATFSFCCPYRTATWVNLPIKTREALVAASRPVLQQMMNDCAPRVVIVAGIAGEAVFRETMGAPFIAHERLSDGPYTGTYRWRATDCSWGERHFTLAQIPHLSRANSKVKLAECGSWLSALLTRDTG